MSLSRTPLYRELARLLQAQANCRKAGNAEWLDKHGESIRRLVYSFMPSGSGIDGGTTLDLDASKPSRLVFTMSFHHMNEVGMYDGWTHHTLIVTPSLVSGIDLRITGRDRNRVKEYLYEVYHHALTQEVWQTADGAWHSELYEPTPVCFEQGGGI
jgi:hypothetical protein